MRSIPLFKIQAEVNDAMSMIENSGYKEARAFTKMDPHLWSSTHNNTNINEAHHNINLDGKSLLSAVHVNNPNNINQKKIKQTRDSVETASTIRYNEVPTEKNKMVHQIKKCCSTH
ncbi:8921_t:CDS:2 [Entrophospora sp. SA101]|nr:8921_t:CDS:2 [Entrophospora sp. SA101]